MRLRVKYEVDYEIDGLPGEIDDDLATVICERLIAEGGDSFAIDLDDENDARFDATGWSVEAGPFGDLKIGSVR